MIGTKTFLDIDLLDDFFSGNSRNNLRTSNGRILTDIRIKSSLRALVGELQELIRQDFLEHPLEYAEFWKPLIERHKLRKKIKDPYTLDHEFVEYFKLLPKKHKQKLFSTLEENIKY